MFVFSCCAAAAASLLIIKSPTRLEMYSEPCFRGQNNVLCCVQGRERETHIRGQTQRSFTEIPRQNILSFFSQRERKSWVLPLPSLSE